MRNVSQKEAEKILKYRGLKTAIQRSRTENKKNDTSCNRDNYNYLKIVQKVPQQDTWKAH